jgi:hypothetical protein
MDFYVLVLNHYENVIYSPQETYSDRRWKLHYTLLFTQIYAEMK